MPQLLLEIFSEEIPARMQERAREGLEKAMLEWLGAAGLHAENPRSFAGPRRLVFVADGLPEKSADVKEERKGPKVGAPEKAIEGFMRGAGLTSIDEAEVRDDKKGQFYVAVIEKPGRKTTDVVADAVVEIIKDFHWPKSMRWGDGELRWVRPIQSILCVFDGKVVPFEVGGVQSGDTTEGHRVMGRGPFTVKGFDEYAKVLREEGHVILDAEERKAIILQQARAVCADAKLELVDDEGLLNEVAGLAEWPVVLLGDMDPAFLDLPPEVIKLSMRTHQKYFAVRDPKKHALAPRFVVVANLEALDGGLKIAQGNARVLSARLNDARFFWDNDRAAKLEDNFDKLGQIVFHEKLGTVKDKAERVMALARELAPIVGADPDEAERAAKLAKCDLVSEMVFEFPELQGVMGRYYAELEGQPQPIADAIRDHYKPQGPSDDVPSEPVAVAVALADKLDTLVGFWAIDEKPTGSRDPFALRRAALGILRLIRSNDVKIELVANNLLHGHIQTFEMERFSDYAVRAPVIENLCWGFLEDRLAFALRDEGLRHDHIAAAFGVVVSGFQIRDMVRRVEALRDFLTTEDGENLLSGYRRAANILRIEEKSGDQFSGLADPALFEQPEERGLFEALELARAEASRCRDQDDFSGALKALAHLRGPVDAFFDEVTVNAEQVGLRKNRLRLLASVRDDMNRLADFSKIEG